MPPVKTVFRSVAPLAPGVTALPHGLYDAAAVPAERIIAAVAETAPDNGANVVELVSWDSTNLVLNNNGPGPQSVEVEAIALYPHLGLGAAYPTHRNVQAEIPPAIAPGTFQTVVNALQDNGGPKVPTFELAQVIAGLAASAGQYGFVLGAFGASRDIVVDAGAGGPQTFRSVLATWHSIQRAGGGLSTRDCLISTLGPVTLDGGSFVELPHGLREADIDVKPDIAAALVVGGNGEGNPLTAPVFLVRSLSDDSVVRWDNLNAPGAFVTIYGCHVYLHSSGRVA